MTEDRYIIQEYLNGRTDAIGVLFEEYKMPLYKFCYHLTINRHEADDLFQETWVRVVQNIASFDINKKFDTWLFTIAINLYKDRYRKAKRWLKKIKMYFSDETKVEEIEGILNTNKPIEEQIEERQQREFMYKCINEMQDIYRIPVILFYFKEMSYDQIAEILNIPIGTVKSRLNSARTKLRTMLGDELNG